MYDQSRSENVGTSGPTIKDQLKEKLKDDIENEIARDAEQEVSLTAAQEMLSIEKITEEFLALKKRVVSSQFKYLPEKAKQALRPYQTEALAKLKELIDDRLSTVAVQLPTGAGKTYLIHSYIYKHVLKKARNVLIISPSWEIAHQHAMTMCQGFKDGASRVRRLGGCGQIIENFAAYKTSDKGKVLITTSALFYARAEKLSATVKAALVVIDEGHHGWRKKRLNTIQAFARSIGAPTVLLTATPPLNMEQLPFAAQLKYLDLVPEFLVPCEVLRLDTGEQFDPVIRNGVLSQKSRVELSSRRERFERIVAQSIPHLKGQTIYYAGSVAEAMGVVKQYKDQGITATVVHSKWTSQGEKINALAIEKFRTGKVQVLVNVQMLAMGFDVPNVETIVVARPVESDTLFTQMVGRGARPAEGKDKFLLIDVHDTISKPEVAKIFEHKHMFYAGVEEIEPVVAETAVVDGPLEPEVAPVLPLRPRAIEVRPDIHLDYLRCLVVVPYFLDPHSVRVAA